jgi:hypothetical protein
MTEFSTETQPVVDAYEQTADKYAALAVLRAAINNVVPEEPEAPKAEFDSPPRKLWNFGKKEEKWGYEHSDYIRLQIAQEELNFKWEQRQQTRALMLAIITELEVK